MSNPTAPPDALALQALLRGTLDDAAEEQALRRWAQDAEPASGAADVAPAEQAELDEALRAMAGRLAAAEASRATPRTGAAWERLQARLPQPWWRRLLPDGLSLSPRVLAGGAGLAAVAAAPVVVQVGRVAAAAVVVLGGTGSGGPRPEGPATGGGGRAAVGGSGIKGSAADRPELELVVDGPGGLRTLDGSGDAATADRVVARVRLSVPAWLYLVHRGPAGAPDVLPFGPGRLDPGVHIPVNAGQPVAYALSGEPGAHTFEVLASERRLPPERLRDLVAGGSALPAGVARVAATLEVR